MRFNGSKQGCRDIAQVIQSVINPTGWYVEPFCGACKVMESVRHPYRLAFDVDEPITTLLKAVQDGWKPPLRSTEEGWNLWKERHESGSRHPMIGFLGYGCSFGGMFFHSYIRPEMNRGLDPASETRNSLLKQRPKLEGVQFAVCDYRVTFPHGSNFTWYCDPPYKGTFKVGSGKKPFDSRAFWKWAAEMSNCSTVLVSEYECPLDFASVLWQRTKQSAQGNNHKGKKPTKTEKLFCLDPDLRCGLGIQF